MIKTKLSFIAFLLLFSSSLTFAQNPQEENRSNWALGIKVGTTGGSLELTRALGDSMNLRLGYNDLSYDREITDANLNYDGEISKTSGSLLLDWHPWQGNFRISTGLYSHQDNFIEVTALPVAGSLEFNGALYDASFVDSVTGLIDMGSVAPYLGIGWGNAVRGGRLSFLLELGLQFNDLPDITMTINNCSLPGTLCTNLAADVEAEITEIRRDIKDFEDYWPVLNLGISYRF